MRLLGGKNIALAGGLWLAVAGQALSDTPLNLELIKASLGRCSNDPGFDPAADLNDDGCVNVLDIALSKSEATGPDTGPSGRAGPARMARLGVSEEIAIEPLSTAVLPMMPVPEIVRSPSFQKPPPLLSAVLPSRPLEPMLAMAPNEL